MGDGEVVNGKAMVGLRSEGNWLSSERKETWRSGEHIDDCEVEIGREIVKLRTEAKW